MITEQSANAMREVRRRHRVLFPVQPSLEKTVLAAEMAMPLEWLRKVGVWLTYRRTHAGWTMIVANHPREDGTWAQGASCVTTDDEDRYRAAAETMRNGIIREAEKGWPDHTVVSAA